jgi:hypothetical protein
MEQIVIRYPKVNGIYYHYKGGEYVVHCLAKDDNGVTVVVYKSILFGSWHTKPLSMWFDKIPANIEAGLQFDTERFSYSREAK